VAAPHLTPLQGLVHVVYPPDADKDPVAVDPASVVEKAEARAKGASYI